MIEWKPNADMFKDWDATSLPIIPTNLTDFANAGIAATIRAHTPPNEFSRMHRDHPTGGLLSFSNGKYAWDLPTKRDLKPGTPSDLQLIQMGLRVLSLSVGSLYDVGIETILLPKIGSGLGRLKWQDVWDGIVDLVGVLSSFLHFIIYAEETSERTRIKIPVTL
jgi:hypothetical protein